MSANTLTDAEASLRAGDPDAALARLQAAVRSQPGNAKLRVFLFQLLAVLGQWERALNQLNVATELDASTLAMAQMYRETLRCELLRNEVFAGKRVPLLFGEPDQWVALLLESLLTAGRGDKAAAARLREQAFELAPATAGRLDDGAFAWLADADARLGPMCEAVINGRYYWLPFSRLASIAIEAPADLRDFVWTPAHFTFTNGGEAVGVIPTRYPGSESSADGTIKLARRTEWLEQDGDYLGLGQRLLVTDAGEYPLLDIRRIEFDTAPAEPVDG
ncbi:type VI secretion system accessory protein TagJ [Azoarcus sp. TTM-91]|uniref:type VI secretion system accessory protein TagJ n=1 Tax=Azoarcus sp. TTM-91 TaxID=2691581 RepID=UPI00145F65FE|nr:type VI secretion system accessory protein TagJ [Azoarcus sp. TTM-91]